VVVDTVDVLIETFFDVDKVVVEIFTVDLTNVVWVIKRVVVELIENLFDEDEVEIIGFDSIKFEAFLSMIVERICLLVTILVESVEVVELLVFVDLVVWEGSLLLMKYSAVILIKTVDIGVFVSFENFRLEINVDVEFVVILVLVIIEFLLEFKLINVLVVVFKFKFSIIELLVSVLLLFSGALSGSVLVVVLFVITDVVVFISQFANTIIIKQNFIKKIWLGRLIIIFK
jgi:hypothetical protein